MLNMNNIDFAYGDTKILSQFNLAVSTGDIVGILGASGSGKSTVLRLIAGLENVQSGQITIASNDVTGKPPYKRKVGFVFQDFALFPHLSVRKNIEYGVKHLPKDVLEKQVQKYVTLLNLQELLQRYPHELSGGQRQRVALARTMITEPNVLLLDEPFSSLDAHLKDRVRLELKEIIKEMNLTTLLVTHDKEDAEVMCDSIISLT